MKTANMERVRRALGSLNQDDLLMLVLTRIEGLSTQEMAEVLGVTPESAARSIRGAEESLRRRMTGDPTVEKRAS
jgi:DNA-directed RNA polymerase specialized sigma24 family protein